MQVTRTLLGLLFLNLIVINSSGTELEVKRTSNNGLATESSIASNQNHGSNKQMDGLDSVRGSKKFDQEKKGEDPEDVPRDGVENVNLDENTSSKQLGSKESQSVQMKTNRIDSVKESEKEKKGGEDSGSKDLPKESKSSLGEECDPSNSCSVEKSTLVACLRVPGNESPYLSLLIQNKGKAALSVTISAPDFVELEKTRIQLREEENSKVRVSIGTGRSDSYIVLTTGDGNCSLNFRDLVVHDSIKEADYFSHSTYFNFLGRTYSSAFPLLAVLLIMASIWTCISFARRHLAKSGAKYQKLDMELPVSGGGQVEMGSNDGWDNSWGDSWDDEEASMTHTMPITPSLSSKGASRRFNKEGWKD